MKLKLVGSLRSPYVRRIRVALLEMNAEFNFEVADVWNPSTDFLRTTPLERVPVLVLPSGPAIYDSHSIQAWLFERYRDQPLFSLGYGGFAKRLSLISLATGIMDLSVQRFLELLRGAPHSQAEVVADCERAIANALAVFEKELAHSHPFLCGDTLRIEDIDLAVAGLYSDFRVGRWMVDRFQNVRAFLNRVEKRISLQSTIPTQ